jgi:hypothetical protein
MLAVRQQPLPKAYAEHYAARPAACRGYHIGSLQELLPTICDPVGPLLVVFYEPRQHTGMGNLLRPHFRGG